MSPTAEGRVSTTELPGKSLIQLLLSCKSLIQEIFPSGEINTTLEINSTSVKFKKTIIFEPYYMHNSGSLVV